MTGIALKVQRLRRRALSLGSVKAFDQALQSLLPVILVRCLDAATFGEYRLLWLVVGTVMAIVTLNMAQSLYYFLPRLEAPRRRLFVHQTFVYLGVAGVIFAALVSPWNPLLPDTVAPLHKYGGLVPVFLALWVSAELLDVVPTAEERIRWQAWATVTVALLRVALVGAGAWATGDLTVILWLLIAIVCLKLLILAAYVRRHHGLGSPWAERRAFAEHFRYAAPLGLAAALYGLRKQADQWVAAALFPLASFGAFSIAAMLSPIVYVFKTSIIQALLPSMSRLEAAGDVRGMLEMNRRGNVLLAAALFPILAFVFAFARDIVVFFFTDAYLDAVPVMRLYIVGFAALAIEVGSVIGLLRQGTYALLVNTVVLAFAVAVSWLAAGAVGLVGAAAGSVVAIYLDRVVTFRRVARLTGSRFAELQDWRGLAIALGYAAVSAAVIWTSIRMISLETPFARLAVGGIGLALAYVPILVRWRNN